MANVVNTNWSFIGGGITIEIVSSQPLRSEWFPELREIIERLENLAEKIREAK